MGDHFGYPQSIQVEALPSYSRRTPSREQMSAPGRALRALCGSPPEAFTELFCPTRSPTGSVTWSGVIPLCLKEWIRTVDPLSRITLGNTRTNLTRLPTGVCEITVPETS